MPQIANKTGNVAAFPWADVTSATVSLGTPQSCDSKFELAVRIAVGRRSGSAFTAGWPNIRIDGSLKSSGDDCWAPLYTYQPQIGASIANTTLSAGPSAGATTFSVTSATNIAVGDLLFLGDTTSAGYEVVRVKAVSGTTITPEDPLTFAHANGALVTDQAEIVTQALSIAGYQRYRVVADNSNSGRDISVQVIAGTLDSVG